MQGLAASVVLLAILLGVLLVVVFDVFCLLHLGKADTVHFLPKFAWAVLVVCTSPIGGLVYLLAQRLPKRSPEPPRKPVPWMGIGSIILILLIIGLWTGIKSASNPQPQPAGQLPCPAGPIWVLTQRLCEPLSGSQAAEGCHGYSRTTPHASRPGLTHVSQLGEETWAGKKWGAALSATRLRFYSLEFHAISKR